MSATAAVEHGEHHGPIEVPNDPQYGLASPGKLGTAIASLLGQSPKAQIQADLRRFKQIMEAGEIPTTEGQPRGK